MISIPLVYIAAPYTAKNEDTREVMMERQELNVGVARHMGCLIAELGMSPWMPTVNSFGFDELTNQGSWEFWMQATSKQLSVCDVAFFCQGWHKSHGCKEEMKQAREMGIPIFRDFELLEQWWVDQQEGVINYDIEKDICGNK